MLASDVDTDLGHGLNGIGIYGPRIRPGARHLGPLAENLPGEALGHLASGGIRDT